MNKKEKTRNAVMVVVDEINKAITHDNTDILSVSSVEQLVAFKTVFLDVLEKIDKNNIPLKHERNLGISKIIIDQWPFSIELGSLIVKAETLYKEI